MPMLKRLQDYLDEHKISYQLIRHQEAFTAAEIAHTLHISGKNVSQGRDRQDGRWICDGGVTFQSQS